MPRFLSVAQGDATAPRPIHGALTGTAYKRLVVSALPGVQPDGTLPEGIAAQAEQAFENLVNLLSTAGLRREDLLTLTAYVAEPGAKALVHRIASGRLTGLRPTTAVRQVAALSQAGSLIEIDAEAVSET